MESARLKLSLNKVEVLVGVDVAVGGRGVLVCVRVAVGGGGVLVRVWVAVFGTAVVGVNVAVTLRVAEGITVGVSVLVTLVATWAFAIRPPPRRRDLRARCRQMTQASRGR